LRGHEGHHTADDVPQQSLPPQHPR
jgi:hypothetical protein